MTKSDWKAKFERLGPTQVADHVPSGSREVVALKRQPSSAVDAIAAILELRRCGLGVLRAKRVVEAVLAGEQVVLEVPLVADRTALQRALEKSGIHAKVRSRQAPDIPALRRRLGLTQEQFATRFGLDVDAVRNWEHERRAPDTAARSLLTVIARFPDLVAEALDG